MPGTEQEVDAYPTAAVGPVPTPWWGGTVNVVFPGVVDPFGFNWLSVAVLLPLLTVGSVAGALRHLWWLIATPRPGSGVSARRRPPSDRCDAIAVADLDRARPVRRPAPAVAPARAPPTFRFPSDPAAPFRR